MHFMKHISLYSWSKNASAASKEKIQCQMLVEIFDFQQILWQVQNK